MRFRNLFTPSFRNRLRLFFVVIVILPMIAVGFVLFQLVSRSEESQSDAQLSEAQRVAQNLYRDAATRANDAGGKIVADEALRRAIADKDSAAINTALTAASRKAGAKRVLLDLDGPGRFTYGNEAGVAPARNNLTDQNGQPLGRLVTAVESAESFAEGLDQTAEIGVVVLDGKQLVAASRPALARETLPESGSADVDGSEYRVSTLKVDGFDGGDLQMRLALEEDNQDATPSLLVLGALLGFLVLAIAFAITVTRTLQSEIQSLLEAAQAIGRGDFSKRVPAEGNDEFAALGNEFNSMAGQLEGRLEELQRERARLADAIRRVGESFTKSLDRVGLMEVVVQTAVDGVEAACGRATINRDGKLQEVTATGDPRAYERALHAAEAAALDAGQVAEIEVSGSSALAAPLVATDDKSVGGIVSVARGDRRFTPGERELFSYLTNQASMSVENVDLHETVQRQAVTDELTGLFNHRRFQEVITQEVERARRYHQEMGLIMLDIDNFKRVNDTYGHLQGDMVLREVARVLRQSSREIDEPARYGGEEMAVALPQTDLEGAFQFAERVRRRIEALDLPLLDGDGTLKVTASFGAASLAKSATGDGKDALVAAADAALYRAKRSGKNRTVRAE
jgi:diguanylate cyclase (GGDEF)-like protein